jgi:hypothetical protein
MTITDNTTLKAYIDRQLGNYTTVSEKAKARFNLTHAIANITGLAFSTVDNQTRKNPHPFSARNYALINAAINDGRLPS